jgi:BirA family biotin operon repressor/biotin-[acetyl-CoA-carboxylase] ligase
MSGPRVALPALRAALGSAAAMLDIEWVEETGSTNADLLKGARAATDRPRLLVADRQTAGRGRRGRRWHGAPGASLTFSLAWPFATNECSGLSLAIGVALAEALDPHHDAEAGHVTLKWPNDLWLAGGARASGRKLGGILVETAPLDDGRRVAVIGVGLNICEQRVDDASSGVAWLREIEPEATPLAVLARVVSALLDALRLFESEGFPVFSERFAARDLLRGRPVRCNAGETEVVDGVAVGVSPAGELLVRTGRGVERIGSGEVSVRLAGGEAASAAERTGATC